MLRINQTYYPFFDKAFSRKVKQIDRNVFPFWILNTATTGEAGSWFILATIATSLVFKSTSDPTG